MPLTWRGPRVREKLIDALSATLVEFDQAAERDAKQRLFPGHGYDTGTLQRSIHAAAPDYNWHEDDVPRSTDTPERGGRNFTPEVQRKKILAAVGSGMRYAIYVHQSWYRFIRDAVINMASRLDGILDYHVRTRSD